MTRFHDPSAHHPYRSSRILPRSHLLRRRLYFHPLHSPCTAPIQHNRTIGLRPSEQLFNLSLLRLYGKGPHQYNPRNLFRVLPGGLFFRARRIHPCLARRFHPPT